MIRSFLLPSVRRFSTMPAHEAMLTRRTVGKGFADKPVPASVLERAVQCAIKAPNHKLTEPWRFVLLGEESKEKLVQLNQQVVATAKGERQAQRKAEAWRRVPHFLAVLCGGQSITATHTSAGDAPSEMTLRQMEDYAATCCAVHNLTLSLHADGVSSKWGTGAVTRQAPFRDLIDAKPDELVVGLLMLGIVNPGAKHKSTPPQKRREWGDVYCSVD